MKQKIAILAGGGRLPEILVHHCIENNIELEVVVFKGQPKPNLPVTIKPLEFGLGSVSKVMKCLKEKKVSSIVMAGNLSKPSLFDLKLDVVGFKIMASLKSKHDDAILRKIAEYFTLNGLSVIGAHELMPELLAPKGIFSNKEPTKQNLEDIKLAQNVAKVIGKLDIGQGAIVKDGVVLGVEAVEGTDNLIERCATFRGKKNKGGVLVKCAKPNQDLRFDMPTIGEETVKKLAELGYEGVAVSSNSTIVVDFEKTVNLAKKLNIFLYGV